MINMTNVEYIDYFEKIIANEPENILSLYFVQKLINGIQFIQVLLEANGLVAGKDHQFKGRYDAEKNAVIISLETDEQEK